MTDYIPSQEILDKYADVMINFALNGGAGIQEGEVVRIMVPESARPIYDSLYKTFTQEPSKHNEQLVKK